MKPGEKRVVLVLAPVALLAVLAGWIGGPSARPARMAEAPAARPPVRREVGAGFWVGCTRRDLAEMLRRTPEERRGAVSADVMAHDDCVPFLPGVPVEVEAEREALRLVRVPGAQEAYWLPWESLD